MFISNPLPDDKILALSKLKTFADDNLKVVQKLDLFFIEVKSIVGKGEEKMMVTRTFSFSHDGLSLCGKWLSRRKRSRKVVGKWKETCVSTKC